ncbi:phospholipase D/nuclease [Linderina pennispora]|uniref:Phospholipase D/nuclease n=1 Tax=Linderina pennispora TaxID=61395 RepID=A0A1Y1VVJ0_9FUNG|nr:phospholipase D/nuclease [Linderina pennispora]ORX65025.1 phospholipase D/nuclease [Linderina pennispora]
MPDNMDNDRERGATHHFNTRSTSCPNSEAGAANSVISISDTSDIDDGDDVIAISSDDTSDSESEAGDILPDTGKQGRLSATPLLSYPHGTVRITHLQDERSASDDMITFEALVQPEKLRKAILSAYVVDMEWLTSKFRSETKIVLVENYNPKTEHRGAMQFDRGMLTIVHPEFNPRQMYPIVHSKFMLLFYDAHVRLVVGSANLIPVDWSIIQNILFIQDLPYTPNQPQPTTEFGISLTEVLLDLSVPSQAVAQLNYIDFRKVTVHLVASVPTSYRRSIDHSTHYGISRLAQVVHKMKPHMPAVDNASLNLYVYGTSMSAITEQYLAVFYKCAQGPDPQSLNSMSRWCMDKSAVRVYIGFHTEDQAQEFRYESQSRSSLVFMRSMYTNYSFPRDRLYKIRASSPRVATHAKVIMARLGRAQDHGWVYLGSHNFTQGAWGRPKDTSRPNINNYELGVVIPDISYSVEAGHTHAMWNGVRVPLSFDVDWEPYNYGDIPCLRDNV